MKRLLAFLLVAVFVVSASVAMAADPAPAAGPKAGPNVGDLMKPFSLQDPIENKSVTLKDTLSPGKDTVILFMNTTCSLCLAQENLFISNWDKIKGKVSLFLVSVDFDPKRIALYKEAQKIPFTILHDKDTSVLESVDFSGTPAIVVLDSNGTIKDKFTQSGKINDYIKKASR